MILVLRAWVTVFSLAGVLVTSAFAVLATLPGPPSGLAAWAGIITPIVVGILGFFLRGKLNEIHVLVNNRLTVALAGTAAMKRKLGIPLLQDELTAEKDVAAQNKDAVNPTT